MVKPFVIFDVEGTLVDCVQQILECWRRTFRNFGFEFSLPEIDIPERDMITDLLPAPDAPNGCRRP